MGRPSERHGTTGVGMSGPLATHHLQLPLLRTMPLLGRQKVVLHDHVCDALIFAGLVCSVVRLVLAETESQKKKRRGSTIGRRRASSARRCSNTAEPRDKSTHLELVFVEGENIAAEPLVEVAFALEARRAEKVEQLLPLSQRAADEVPPNVLRGHLPDNLAVDTRVAQVPEGVSTLVLPHGLCALSMKR